MTLTREQMIQEIRANTLGDKPGLYGYLTKNKRWIAEESFRNPGKWLLREKNRNDPGIYLDSLMECQEYIDRVVLSEDGE